MIPVIAIKQVMIGIRRLKRGFEIIKKRYIVNFAKIAKFTIYLAVL